MAKRSRRKPKLERLLNAVSTPLFLLSGRREVGFFNAGCEHLTGWPADDVLSLVCDYTSGGEYNSLEALTESLCPPPEVFSGETLSVLSQVARRTGEPIPRMLYFYPLRDDSGTVVSVLGVMSPPPERTAAEKPNPARQLHSELASLRNDLRRRFGVNSFVCQSGAMTRVLRQIQLAGTSNFALIQGEPGTGKEHVARLIHYASAVRQRSFVPLDCRQTTALELKQVLRRVLSSARDDPEQEYFDHFALKPGTIYLKNVESLPRDLQQVIVESHETRSLHAAGPSAKQPDGSGLQARPTAVDHRPADQAGFQPDQRDSQAGQSTSETADLKWIAATTGCLHTLAESEVFRPDFYYLFTTFVVELPPLRERDEDLAPLAQAILEELNRDDEKQVGGFSDGVWKKFQEYNWPANVDELTAVIEEARRACGDSLIRPEDLPFRFRTGLDAQAVGPPVQAKPTPLEPLLARVEREQIEIALTESKYNKSKAAQWLGITRARLYRRMEALGVQDRDEIL